MNYLLRTSEIILKGKNRKFFEKVLIENIKKILKNDLVLIKNYGGLYFIQTKKEVSEKIKKILGIANFSKVEIFESLEDLIKNLNTDEVKEAEIKVSRGDKDYPLTSPEIIQKIKKEIQIDKEKKPSEFSKTIYIYYKDKKFFLYNEKIKTYGGLPVGSSGKGLSLISGGIDSPVASFLAMKRGLKIYFLHFTSYPQTSKESIEKVKKIVEVLNEYNLNNNNLYLINILDLQKFYFQNIPSPYLFIFYRRSMFRLADRLAKELKLDCLITGESLGQVASQTIQNLRTISYNIQTFILRPNIGLNKEEIIELAKKIGTYNLSILTGDDCCSLFLPKKVKTKANLEEVLKIENKFKKEIEELENKSFETKTIL